jgi:hypothetical protein
LLAQNNPATPTIPTPSASTSTPNVTNQPSIPTNIVIPPSDPQNDLTTQVKMLSQQILDIQLGKYKKEYSQNDLCPYPFDDSIANVPFPAGFEIPKFDKYKGTTNPIDHIREFYIHCMDVGKSNALLIRLFPRILSRAAMEWFSRLPSGLIDFQDIVDLFINHFSFNMDMDVSLQELNGLKQARGETFAKFLQRWRNRASKSKWTMAEEQQVETIIEKLEGELSFQIKMKCITTYDQLIPKALNIERALIAQGYTPTYKDNPQSTSQGHDKPRTWAKNKNVTDDGVINAKVIINSQQSNPRSQSNTQHNTFVIQSQPTNNQNVHNINDQQAPPPHNKFPQKRKYTPLGGPIEVVIQKLIQANLITLPTYENYREPQVKPSWYNENHLCDFHKIKGHTTARCMKLENLIQDLIETKQIEIKPQGGNKDLKIYMNPMPDHGKGKAKEIDYTKVNHTYDANVIFFLEEVVSVVTIKGPNAEYGVTTRGGKVTIVGPSPSSSKAPPKQKPNPEGYSVLEQLNKIPTQISILELLRISPVHKEILKKALSASTIPKDIDASQFQAMVGHIAMPHSLKFSDADLPSQRSHNCALHLEVWIQSTKVKRVLVDGGASLNICSLKVLKAL